MSTFAPGTPASVYGPINERLYGATSGSPYGGQAGGGGLGGMAQNPFFLSGGLGSLTQMPGLTNRAPAGPGMARAGGIPYFKSPVAPSYPGPGLMGSMTPQQRQQMELWKLRQQQMGGGTGTGISPFGNALIGGLGALTRPRY